jgi:hypothetical protein
MGVALALPWFESLGAAGRPATRPPLRLGFVFTPNGVHYPSWLPGKSPGGFTLSETLAPLESVKHRVNILTGLTLDRARANGDGPGDHARSSASFLTGMQARKTAGNDIRIGVSVDQYAAAQVGARTRLPSLELGCEAGRRAGNCDSGYSCAYVTNIAWQDEDTPVPKITDPALAFDRLFGEDGSARDAARLRSRRSILDFVLDEASTMERRLGAADRRRLDEYQSAVRAVERRIAAAADADVPADRPHADRPAGIPPTATEHIDLMYDLLALAFQTDTTRIATLMVGVDGSNRAFPEIGIRDGHHHLSHHQGDAEMIENIRRIDRLHTERFARFVAALDAMPEDDGTVLDNCLVVHGSGISDGNAHNHEDLPILVAGGGSGTVRTGRLVEHPSETPLCALYLAMLDRMGCDAAAFGDADQPLATL